MQFFWLDKKPPLKEAKLMFKASTIGEVKQFRGKRNIIDGLGYISGYAFEIPTTLTPKLDKLMEYNPKDPENSPFIRKNDMVSPLGELRTTTVWIYKANEKLRPDLIHTPHTT